jgi:hypothetical protein
MLRWGQALGQDRAQDQCDRRRSGSGRELSSFHLRTSHHLRSLVSIDELLLCLVDWRDLDCAPGGFHLCCQPGCH